MKDFQTENIQENDSLNIRAELEKFLVHWKWFVLGIFMSLLVAYIYLRYSTPQYVASTSILIKDNNKSGISDELKAVSDLGIVGTGSANNTDNEIQILKSRKILGSVVDTLKLYASFYVEGRVKITELYEKNFSIEFLEKSKSFNVKDSSFVISFLDNKNIELSNELNGKKINIIEGQIINSSLGKFQIKFHSREPIKEKKVYVNFRARDKIINSLKARVGIAVVNRNSSVLNLTLQDVVSKKAVDILNELVIQYNLDAIKDKNIVSEKTKTFIEERLLAVGAQLGIIQDNVKNFKTKFGITGLSSEGEMALTSLTENNKRIVEIKSQLSLVKWIQNKLKNEIAQNEILPNNLGFTDVTISSSIQLYNDLILNIINLETSAGNLNPELVDAKKQLTRFKGNLFSNLSNAKKSLEIQLNQLDDEAKKAGGKLENIPAIERGMIDIERQKIIYSELYSYLLKKKEETAISLAVTVPNAKIIDYGYSTGVPVSPKKRNFYLLALVLGFLVPFVIIYLKQLLDTKIHSRKDIEDLTTIPFLGDVPHSETDEKIVIGNDSRTSTAEAFRLIRTNLDFMMSNNKNNNLGRTIFITSTTSGEGKSFISINLAAALSLSNKKVLLLGMDLRAPKVTEYLGIPERKGITNFITNGTLTLNDIKFTIPEIKGLDIIASGVIPPNPAELLLGPRTKELFDEVKKEYDYIIVDTAPVNLVTDTFLISKYADISVYVSRANYLDKRMLKVAQNLYNEKKLHNMAIVLNDTDMTRGYGYGYGYGYGAMVMAMGILIK